MFIDILIPVPVLYFTALLFYKLFAHKRFVKKVYHKVCVLIHCEANQPHNDFEGPLPWPDRMINAEEYAPLLGSVGNHRNVIVEGNDRSDLY